MRESESAVRGAPPFGPGEFAESLHVGGDFLDRALHGLVLVRVEPERIHPRMRLDGGTSRRPARRSMSARSSGERQVATVPDLFGCLNMARRLPAVPADRARVPPRCVYIYPAGGREPSGGAEGRRHASVQSWLRADVPRSTWCSTTRSSRGWNATGLLIRSSTLRGPGLRARSRMAAALASPRPSRSR